VQGVTLHSTPYKSLWSGLFLVSLDIFNSGFWFRLVIICLRRRQRFAD